MKFFVATAVVAAAIAISTVDAAAQSTLHIRVHVSDENEKHTGVVGEGQPCGGQYHSGPTTCVSGTTCVRHSQWHSQCMPNTLRLNDLCAMNKQDNTWSFPNCPGGPTRCIVSNPDGSESRCK